MRALRLAGAIGCGFSLVLGGCGTTAAPKPDMADANLTTAVVTTVTTVQASSGLFLSPSPQQDVPSYVAHGDAATPLPPMDGLDRTKVDVAVLFQGSLGSARELTAELGTTSRGEWSPIEHDFPAFQPAANGGHWPLELLDAEEVAATDESTEWSGWRAFGGLGVRTPGSSAADAPSAAVATLDFTMNGAPSPLVLSTDGTVLTVSNRSAHVIERALLVYSHSAGVGVTAVNALGPGESSITTLGPKEHPAGVLLDLARAQLRDFFAVSVGDELGAAMAEAKSIPFLETQGLRLISVLETTEAPTTLEFSRAIASRRQVVVSHSEILKLEEETHILSVVADESLQVGQVTTELGRFSEGKLEYATVNGDAAVSARAASLLEQLRGR
jgi:hypothetical protein